MINNILSVFIFIFVWVSSFLIHELMHIAGQGHLKGKIYVNGLGMKVIADPLIYPKWFHYSGGILTSIVMFIMVTLSYGWWAWCFLTLGWVQLCYGLYEGYIGTDKRFLIYFVIVVIMLSIWVLI
jgi:hypothetical protein